MHCIFRILPVITPSLTRSVTSVVVDWLDPPFWYIITSWVLSFGTTYAVIIHSPKLILLCRHICSWQPWTKQHCLKTIMMHIILLFTTLNVWIRVNFTDLLFSGCYRRWLLTRDWWLMLVMVLLVLYWPNLINRQYIYWLYYSLINAF